MKKMTIAIMLVFFAATGCSAARPSIRKSRARKRPGAGAFLGISMVAAPGLKPIKGVSAGHGVKVALVVPDSPADMAGIKRDDIIVAIGEEDFDASSKEVIQQFRDRLAEYSPGDLARIKVVREETLFDISEGGKKVEQADDVVDDLKKYMQGKDTGEELSLKARNVRHVLDFDVTLAGRQGATKKHRTPGDSEIHPELEGYTSPEEELAEALAEHYGIAENYKDLRKRLRGIEETCDDFRLREVIYLHRNPFHMEKSATGIFDWIAFCATEVHKAAYSQLLEAMMMFDIPIELKERYELKSGLSLEEHLEQIAGVLEAAGREREAAFASFSEEDLKLMRESVETLGKIFEETIYIDNNENKEELQRHMRLLKLAPKLQYKHLHNAACELLKLLSPQYLAGLQEDMGKLETDLGARVVAQKDTPYGKIIIGGTGHNWYKDEDAAVIIDLGGNDFYTNNSGASTEKTGCAIVIDLSGDDAYESTRNCTQGAGILGVGILADLAGNDSYIGMRWCQGACALGFGMLLDGEGNDLYRAHAYAQGAALCGVALAVDIGGNDVYESHMLSQGLGMPRGIGILTNAGGDDSYYSKGTYPSSYGTPGIYDGWSQGCGVGFRKYASGGIGILLDTGGADRYEAGNFSQGGGYYFGWGLLNDRGNGDDTYIGSRYAQGFCAHQALGTFIEEGGNDTYASRNAVHAGLAWDQCVTLFIDRAGDDRYTCERGFSQGASAHNSICIFKDCGGKDAYATKAGPGRAGGNSYHGGTSLSLFLDLGGEEDSYTKRAENNAVKYDPEDAILADLPFGNMGNISEIINLCKPYEEMKKEEPKKEEAKELKEKDAAKEQKDEKSK